MTNSAIAMQNYLSGFDYWYYHINDVDFEDESAINIFKYWYFEIYLVCEKYDINY
jgi:hypothetical protein